MTEKKSVSVLLVYRDSLVCEALRRALSRYRDIQCVGYLTNAAKQTLHEKLCRLWPDILIMDIDRPTRTGLISTRQIAACGSNAKVLMTGLPDSDQDIIAAIQAGAAGYLTEKASMDELISNIRALASGCTVCSQHIASLLFSQVAKSSQIQHQITQPDTSCPQLTPRELQIMALIEHGLSNKGIARKLCIELQTVKNHVHNILVKLSLHRRTEVARYVRQHGLNTQSTSTQAINT